MEFQQANENVSRIYHQPLDFTIEFEDHGLKDQTQSNESPLLACLRARRSSTNDPLIARSNHTVSTFGSSLHGASKHVGDDHGNGNNDDHNDNDSIVSLIDDLFDCNPLDAFLDNLSHSDLNDDSVLNAALRIATGPEGHESASTLGFDDFDDFEEEEVNHNVLVETQHDYTPTLTSAFEPESDTTKLDNSMSSLNDAFEGLNSCMQRTAQSRKLVRQFGSNVASSSSGATSSCGTSVCSTTGDYASTDGYLVRRPRPPPSRGLNRRNSTQGIKREGCVGGGLQRVDSSRSVTSIGSLSGSIGSRSSLKGPRSFHKPRRAYKKGSSARTGVASMTSIDSII